MAARAIRVRYAPSPTGFLHLGGLRTALYNYLFARKQGGAFLLRIEDTDKSRQVPGSVEGLIRAMRWSGLEYDEGPADPDVPGATERGKYGPYVQSQRLPLYKQHAEQLVSTGHAYRCFCSSERLTALRESQAAKGQTTLYDRACTHIPPAEADRRAAAGEPHVIRMFVPTGSTAVDDVVLGGVTMPHGAVDDQVLMKSDGYPTYHLASVVDDHMMHISHVIRGQEWLASTPKHVLLYKAFGWPTPAFAHLPLLLNTDKSKLSKRHGDAAVEDFQKSGYLPSALVNFVAMLGWTPPDGREIYTELSELVDAFDLTAVHKGNAVVDRARLAHVNAQHIKRSILHSVQSVAPSLVVPDTRAAAATKKGSAPAPAAVATASSNSLSVKLQEGHLLNRIPDTPALAAMRERVAPLVAEAVTALGAGAATATSSATTAGIAASAEQLNALLVAQHERVSTLPEFVPLLLPFLLEPAQYAAYLRTAAVTQAAQRVLEHLRSKGSKPSDTTTTATPVAADAVWNELFGPTSVLRPALTAILSSWQAQSSAAFAEGAVEAVKSACKSTGVPAGKVMLPLRLAVTGLDAGAGMADTLRLLGRDTAIARLQWVLQQAGGA